MRQPQRERLVRLLRTQSQSGKTRRMRNLMRDMLEDAGMQVRMEGQQLFARKGSADHVPYIVAHADTVHDIVPGDKYFATFDIVDGEIWHYAYDPSTGKHRGVGGDDKCGLWIAQEVARHMNDVGVIVTIDEEIGCLGAKRVTKEQLADATVLIQGDRRGHEDAITRANGLNISSGEWQDHIKRNVEDFGYRFSTFGAGTDVAAMHGTKAAEVSAVNLAAAYYLPHTDQEYVREDKLENAFELALKLAERSARQKWDHIAERHSYVTASSTRSYHHAAPLFTGWWGNEPRAARRGYHATHLIRDSIGNGPKAPHWRYDQQHRLYLNPDRTMCAIFALSGVVVLPWGDYLAVVGKIMDSGYKPETPAFSRTELDNFAYFSGYMRDVLSKQMTEYGAFPTCTLGTDCAYDAKYYHMTRMQWGCYLHMLQVMETEQMQFLSDPPLPAGLPRLDKERVDNPTQEWYYGG